MQLGILIEVRGPQNQYNFQGHTYGPKPLPIQLIEIEWFEIIRDEEGIPMGQDYCSTTGLFSGNGQLAAELQYGPYNTYEATALGLDRGLPELFRIEITSCPEGFDTARLMQMTTAEIEAAWNEHERKRIAYEEEMEQAAAAGH